MILSSFTNIFGNYFSDPTTEIFENLEKHAQFLGQFVDSEGFSGKMCRFFHALLECWQAVQTMRVIKLFCSDFLSGRNIVTVSYRNIS